MYRTNTFIILTFLIVSFLFPIAAKAITKKIIPKASFGGRVATTQIPGITCVGQYWLATKPSGGFPISGPLVITATEKTIGPGSSILGLVNYVPDTTTCFIPTPTGPIYIPSWKIDSSHFNVSKK